MAISKQRKDELVAQYVDLLSQSRAIFLTEYTGLDVKQMQNLRGEVRKAEGVYHVTKNTLLRYALEQSGKPVPTELLVGQLATGFALAEAPALAKVLSEFAKEEESLVLKGGILGSELLTADEIEMLAKLPSRDELRAQIVGLLGAPARNITSMVANGVRQVVNVLDAYSKSEGEAEATA